MTGVEILAQKVMYNTILPAWCAVLGWMFLGVFVVSTVVLAADGNNKYGICGFLCIVCVALLVLGMTSNKNSIDYIEYKVTISDEVSMTEFMEKYEIFEQDGKIYTVRKRE